MKQTGFFIRSQEGSPAAKDTTLDLIDDLGATEIILLCPKVIIFYWEEYLIKDGRFSVCAPVKGSVASRLEKIKVFLSEKSEPRSKIVVINYELISSYNKYSTYKSPEEFITVFDRVWDVAVVDHCEKISNYSKTTRIINQCLKAENRVAVVGSCNLRPEQYFTVYNFLDKKVFGHFREFQAAYLRMGGYRNWQIVGYRNTESFDRKVKSLYIKEVTDEKNFSED